MIIHEYPYNMSCEKLMLPKQRKINMTKSMDAVQRISLYPWPGGYDKVKSSSIEIYKFKSFIK